MNSKKRAKTKSPRRRTIARIKSKKLSKLTLGKSNNTNNNNLPDIIDNDDSKLLKELKVPDIIKTPTVFGPKETYKSDIMQEIIIDVATTKKPVGQITKKYGLHRQVIYYWMMLNPQLADIWKRAMMLRTTVIASDMEEDIQELGDICDNRDNDPRWQHVKTTEFERRWKHREWFMSRINKADFGDSKDIDVNVTVNHIEARAQAWEKNRARDAEYTEIDE